MKILNYQVQYCLLVQLLLHILSPLLLSSLWYCSITNDEYQSKTKVGPLVPVVVVTASFIITTTITTNNIQLKVSSEQQKVVRQHRHKHWYNDIIYKNCINCSKMSKLYANNNDSNDNNNNNNSPNIQFSSLSSSSTTTTSTKSISTTINNNNNVIDTVLTWITSDIGSIILGGIGLVLLLIGRLFLDGSSNNVNDDRILSPEQMGEQTRANLLAVFAIGGVLLNGLSQLDVQTVLAETVDLIGTTVMEPIIISNNQMYTNNDNEQEIRWVLSSILNATPAKTVILLIHSIDTKRWEVIAYVGILPPNMLQISSNNDNRQLLPSESPILDRMLRVLENTSNNAENDTYSNRQESYLPTLQALPGRIELTNYLLPSNTQAALLLPIRYRLKTSSSSTTITTTTVPAVILIGSNQARSFTPRDITWSQTAATRLE